MKNKLHLRNAAAAAMIFGLTLTGCSKEEAILPMQEKDLAAAREDVDENLQARSVRGGLGLDEKTIKEKEPVRGMTKDKVYLNDNRHQTVFGTTGADEGKNIRETDIERQISIHEGQQLSISEASKAVLLDRKEIMGQNRMIGRSGTRLTEKMPVHNELDFSPARTEYKETGARED